MSSHGIGLPTARWIVSFSVFLTLTIRAAPPGSCWSGGVTPEVCCSPAPAGNPSCWDAEYTYERCCVASSSKAAPEVEGLKVDAKSIPSLPLLGGGRMPMSGLGLCCRASANGDAVRQGVLDFLSMGGRHLDDAQVYSNHREVGEGIRQAVAAGVPRSDVFLTTKIPGSDFGFEQTTAWVSQMLAELGLEYVDLVLLHWAGGTDAIENGAQCTDPKACRQETWLALQRAKARGQIRHLGVSNFGPRQMAELLALGGAPIEVNQLEFHPWVQPKCVETVEWCHGKGIAVTAYGSMGSAGMAKQMMSQGALQQIGQQYGKSPGQVLLRWAIQKNVSVIPGTGNPKHMAENLRVFDFELNGDAMAMLDNIPNDQRMLHFGHMPDARP